MPASGKASEAPNPASGPPSPTPFAFFDPSSCSWKTSPPSCAAGSTSSTPIWPRSGTTRAGSAYAHPTSGRHTAVTGCSCWPPDETSSASTAVTTLPTPCARDGKGPGMQRGLPDLIERRPLGVGPGRAGQLLPTPTSGGGTGYLSGNHRDTWGPTLELAVQGYRPSKLGRPGRPEEPALLPTPTAHAYGSNQSLSAGAAVRPSLASRAASTSATTHASRAGSRPEGQAAEIAGGVGPRELDSWEQAPAAWRPPTEPRLWGPYAEAVARWEYLVGRAAPAPTQPGIHGKPVLAPPFVEWLMGLDEGFVTELGLPRTLALRVLGTGWYRSRPRRRCGCCCARTGGR